MKRYELDPVGKKLVETEDGPWVFYADVETLQAQLAEARTENERLRAALVESAGEVDRLGYQLAEARELLKESRDELEHYIDIDWPRRADYPHRQAKWERDMELVWRIDKALAGEGDE